MTESAMYNFNLKGNRKLGVIPVTRSPQMNCPDTCTLKGAGCYAELGPMGWAWQDDMKKGITFENIIASIRRIEKGALWRHNEAGDFAQVGDGFVDVDQIKELVKANAGKRGFTYTHHNPVKNAEIIKFANDNGFTINLSAENMDQVDEYVAMGIAPVVTILPMNAEKVTFTPNGNKVVRCPANETITCKTCKLCQRAERDFVIGFTAHGSRKKKVEKIALQMVA